MNTRRIPVLLLLLLMLFPVSGCSQDTAQYYAIETPKGRMVAMLYDETPQHRDNFAKLVSEAFFDSTTFHRVINGFMIQGGDPNSMDDFLQDDGSGSPGYTLPAEITGSRYHKRGAIAAARLADNVNPDRESNGSQFYIVHGGTPFVNPQLTQIERQIQSQLNDPEFAYTEEARAAYIRDGGAPHLDGAYTVFGEIVEGFDVLDAIAALPTLRKRMNEGDPTLESARVDPALVDQPPERIWMIVRSLPNYQPASQ